jgi:hypothetical protein
LSKDDQTKNTNKTLIDAYFKLPSETYEFFTRSTDTCMKMYSSWLKASNLLSKGEITSSDLSNTLSKDFEVIYSEIFEALFRPMKIISGKPFIDIDFTNWPKLMGLMRDQSFWFKPFERFMVMVPKKVPKLVSELVDAYRNFYESWNNYYSILSTTWKDTSEKFSKGLTEKTANIKNVSTGSLEFWDFYNLWLETYQKTFTDILCLPDIISVQTKLSSSTMEIIRIWRELMEEIVEANPSFPLPTKSEMDDAYKRIHDLRKEIDELRNKIENRQNSSVK